MSSNDNNNNSAQVTLQKIEAVAKLNNEIIQHIKSQNSVTGAVTYHVQPLIQSNGYNFVLSEIREPKKMSEILQQWKSTLALQEVPDMFNEKLNYSCSTFQDLVRLNKQMLKLSHKFAMFGENDVTRNALSAFLKNFELIQTGLGQIDEKTIEPKSRLPELSEEIEKLKRTMKTLSSDSQVIIGTPGLLTDEHYHLICQWTGKTGWVLLYRASRDGFASQNFHSKCDNQGPTVTIIQSKEGYRFGGYSPQSWNSNGNYINDTTNTAFIFSLTNLDRSPTMFKLTQPGNSIQGHSGYGPIFGGHDIHVSSGSNTNSNSCITFPNSYQDTTGLGHNAFIGTRNFQALEIEVYKL